MRHFMSATALIETLINANHIIGGGSASPENVSRTIAELTRAIGHLHLLERQCAECGGSGIKSTIPDDVPAECTGFVSNCIHEISISTHEV